MWKKAEQSVDTVLARERADKNHLVQLVPAVMKSDQCKYIERGSRGDALEFRRYFCHLMEGHACPHKDPYKRDFRLDLHVRCIRKSQMPCEFVAARERTPWEPRAHVPCYRIEGHFGVHCDEYGGGFRSSLLDTDVFTYLGRWPVRTEPFPRTVAGKLE